ncbi:MAG TPA: hypothetical protein VFV87_03610 [Pirellulaceae bacterium]|nr:hypothetical protein [Pirellulaceae bacterium]
MRQDANTPPMGEPLAYFLTWTTYGTWLPGDERGWVKRPGSLEEANPRLERWSRSKLAERALILAPGQRAIVERTIVDHCRIRGWHLWIVRCLSNHVHVVITARDVDPDGVVRQLKAWCTRRLKEADAAEEARVHWWTERASTRYINDRNGLEGAILYVRDAQ